MGFEFVLGHPTLILTIAGITIGLLPAFVLGSIFLLLDIIGCQKIRNRKSQIFEIKFLDFPYFHMLRAIHKLNSP